MSAHAGVPSMQGEHEQRMSYATNSLLQNYNFHTYAKPHLSHALDLLLLRFFPAPAPPPPPAHSPPSPQQHHHLASASASTLTAPPHAQHLKVADFGCSYGPNTLDLAAFVVQGLRRRLRHNMSGDAVNADVELQYFFSDLPGNDFNALFRSLDSFWHELRQQCFHAGDPFSGRLFSAAVAGSFHRHLFPSASLHLALSTYAVQWLSQVPPEVVDRASPAWNGGHIWIHGARPRVVEAYAHQFHKDMKSFLLNRAKEMVTGGVMFLFFPSRAERYPQGAFLTAHHDIWTGFFESTWEDMVIEGLISKEEMDLFNLPFYNCHVTEMQEVLEELLNEFKVVKMEVMKDCSNLPKDIEEKTLGNPQAFGEFVATFVGSLLQPMVQEHLDESRSNELFQRLQNQATKESHLSTSMNYDMILVIIQ